MKILISIIVVFLIIGCFAIYSFYDSSEKNKEDIKEEEYQGPVPIGYDLNHYRKTGETIKGVDR